MYIKHNEQHDYDDMPMGHEWAVAVSRSCWETPFKIGPLETAAKYHPALRDMRLHAYPSTKTLLVHLFSSHFAFYHKGEYIAKDLTEFMRYVKALAAPNNFEQEAN